MIIFFPFAWLRRLELLILLIHHICIWCSTGRTGGQLLKCFRSEWLVKLFLQSVCLPYSPLLFMYLLLEGPASVFGTAGGSCSSSFWSLDVGTRAAPACTVCLCHSALFLPLPLNFVIRLVVSVSVLMHRIGLCRFSLMIQCLGTSVHPNQWSWDCLWIRHYSASFAGAWNVAGGAFLRF